MSVLARVLADAREPVLVVGEDVEAPGPAVAVRTPEAVLDPEDPEERFATVVLVADDVVDLRRYASLCGGLGRARTVVAIVGGGVRGALPVVVHPAWPPIVVLDAQRDDRTAVTALTFAARVSVASVVAGLAAATAPGVRPGPAGLRLAFPDLPDGAAAVPPMDPTVATVVAPDADRPPDVVVGGSAPFPVSEVTGTPPIGQSSVEVGVPLDEGVFNPHGFTRRTKRGVVDLPPGARLGLKVVRGLRNAQGVRVPADADPVLVAALAMSGVPLVRDPGVEVDLEDLESRERYSVRQRRAALVEHASLSWRARLADRASVRAAAYPSVSVVVTPAAGESEDDAVARGGGARTVPLPGATVEVVAAGAGTPTGDVVLRVGADDVVTPDLLTDLLLARRYSGARVVGRPPTPEDAETWGVEVVGPVLVDRTAPPEPGALAYRIHAVGADA